MAKLFQQINFDDCTVEYWDPEIKVFRVLYTSHELGVTDNDTNRHILDIVQERESR